MKKQKIRVNITVDKETLEQAKTKLHFFGGKLSTLFNAYLEDFVSSSQKPLGDEHKELLRKVKELEVRVGKVEGKR
jgi:N-acetylneuraminic acid mutarotase